MVAKQNDAIRAQNENLRKLVEERDAVVRLRPSLVDVSSGVESAPGEKDADLVAAFVAAVGGARRKALA